MKEIQVVQREFYRYLSSQCFFAVCKSNDLDFEPLGKSAKNCFGEYNIKNCVKNFELFSKNLFLFFVAKRSRDRIQCTFFAVIKSTLT